MTKHLDWPLNKEARALLKQFKVFILKGYGKRCKTKANGCVCCQIWALYDFLEVYF